MHETLYCTYEGTHDTVYKDYTEDAAMVLLNLFDFIDSYSEAVEPMQISHKVYKDNTFCFYNFVPSFNFRTHFPTISLSAKHA
jgi:hypothetical protein